MTAIMKYDEARKALAEAKSLKEVNTIRNKNVALEEYARRMRDKDLKIMAYEIRMRSEYRFGELSRELERKPGARRDLTSGKTARGSKSDVLDQLGVTRRHANRCEKLAEKPAEQLEREIAESIERHKNPPKRKPKRKIKSAKPAAEFNANRVAYERGVQISMCVFTACNAIEKAQCTPKQWLDAIYEGGLLDDVPDVFPIIDWLNEARSLYELRRSQETAAHVDHESGPRLQVVGR